MYLITTEYMSDGSQQHLDMVCATLPEAEEEVVRQGSNLYENDLIISDETAKRNDWKEDCIMEVRIYKLVAGKSPILVSMLIVDDDDNAQWIKIDNQ